MGVFALRLGVISFERSASASLHRASDGVVRDLRRRACAAGRRHFLSCRGPDELYNTRDRREYCGHVFPVAAFAAFAAVAVVAVAASAFAADAAFAARLADVRA